MKSIRLVGLCLLCTMAFAGKGLALENPMTINDVLRERIVKLLDRPDLSKYDGQNFQAEVEFMITRQQQIVVLAVYTSNPFLDEYIKEKLNYQKIGIRDVRRLTPYRIDVNFTKVVFE